MPLALYISTSVWLVLFFRLVALFWLRPQVVRHFRDTPVSCHVALSGAALSTVAAATLFRVPRLALCLRGSPDLVALLAAVRVCCRVMQLGLGLSIVALAVAATAVPAQC